MTETLNFDCRELGNYFVTSTNSLSETQDSKVAIGDYVSLKLDNILVVFEVIEISLDSYKAILKSSHYSKLKTNQTVIFKDENIFNLEKKGGI